VREKEREREIKTEKGRQIERDREGGRKERQRELEMYASFNQWLISLH
jgi:hypothetical protein